MTRDDLTTFVLERLGVGSSRTAFVNQIVGHLNRIYVREVVALGLNMDTSVLVFSADNPQVFLPADWRRTETLRIEGRDIIEKTYPDHMQLRATEASGVSLGEYPRYVVLLPPRSYLIVPTPTASETTGELVYHAAPSLMTTGADEPSVLDDEYHDLLGELCVARMAMNQEDPTISQDALAAAAIIREELRNQMVRAGGSSSTRVRRRVYG